MHPTLARSSALCLFMMMLGVRARPELVSVRYPQGSAHAFLELRNLNDQRIATGDFLESVHGSRISCRLTFHFTDGSLDDELTVFSQHRTFRLISDHHLQHGPSFPKPMDVLIQTASGQVTYRTADGKTVSDHLNLPPDVANGLSAVLLMNLPPSATQADFSWVAPTSKPRLVHLAVRTAGEVRVRIGDETRKAVDYIIHVQLGGLTGAVAAITGKQPADYRVLILAGEQPAFLREVGQFYEDGPIWSMQQISPVLPRPSAAAQASNK